MNHKGLKCLYRDIFCQEGFCQDCQVYLDLKEEGVRFNLIDFLAILAFSYKYPPMTEFCLN